MTHADRDGSEPEMWLDDPHDFVFPLDHTSAKRYRMIPIDEPAVPDSVEGIFDRASAEAAYLAADKADYPRTWKGDGYARAEAAEAKVAELEAKVERLREAAESWKAIAFLNVESVEQQSRALAVERAKVAQAWDRGFATGKSRAMRHMSDEPNLSLDAANPYRAALAGPAEPEAEVEVRHLTHQAGCVICDCIEEMGDA